MAFKPAKHGRDHCPGGEDPIPCLGGPTPWARVWLTTDEGIASGANDELIVWDADETDYPEYFTFPDNTKVQVEQDGLYEVTAELVWDSAKTEGSVVTLNSNSTPGFFWNKGWYDQNNASHTIEHTQTFSYLRRLEALTELRLFIVHFAAVTRTLLSGTTGTYMEVRYLGAWDGTAPGD